VITDPRTDATIEQRPAGGHQNGPCSVVRMYGNECKVSGEGDEWFVEAPLGFGDIGIWAKAESRDAALVLAGEYLRESRGRDKHESPHAGANTKMKILIHWQPEMPSMGATTCDEDGLRVFFGKAEADRIMDALAGAKGTPVTLTVNGPDAGYLDLDFVDAEFSVLDSKQR